MSKKWRNVKIGDICDVSSSKRVMAKDYTSTGIPFYRSKEIIELQNGNQITNPLYISKEQFNSIIKKFGGVSEGDILLTSVGTIGVPYIVKSEDEFYFKDGNLTWFKNYKEDINNFYLYHWLKSNFAKKQIDGALIGTTQKALTIDSIKNLHITLPPLEEQEKIANLLSALDNKIELNNQMNKDLEELAQTLYTKWFVNFDFPNEKGKPYKSSGGEMIHSELGEIPAGWKVGELGDLFNFINGFAFKSNSYVENGVYRVITIKNVLQNKLVISENDSKINVLPEKLKSNQILNVGEMLMSLTGEVGRVCLVDESNCLLNQRVGKIELKETFNYSYIYQLLSSEIIKSKICGIATGSIQKNVSTNNILNIKNLIPDKEMLNEFNNICFPLIVQMIKNNQENQQLKETRDLLLPYLMSGKIDLGE